MNLSNFIASVPAQLFGSDQLAKSLPDGIQLPLTGSANHPKLDTSKMLQLEAQSGLQNLLGGNKKGSSTAPSSTQPTDAGNSLDQLLQGLGDNKKKDKKKH
jgi:hypothetical protein